MSAASVLDWFAGGRTHPYHTLWHCMGHDTPWVIITVALDLTVAAGYGVIAYHWWVNQRRLENAQARVALARMRNIFLLCGICGYLFIPVKMFWPAWRLYDIFLVFLAYYTWRYAWGAKDLRVIYAELNRTSELSRDLAASRAESRRKSLFLSALSHDLRTPLFGASLLLSVARKGVETGELGRAQQALDEAESGLHTAARLLESLLSYARIDTHDSPNQVSPIEVKSLAEEIALPVKALASEKGIRLHVAADNVVLRSDGVKVRRVIENLLDNAIKYTSRGNVRLSVVGAPGDNGTPGGVIVEVRDTGIGIDPDAIDRIFEDFYQVHNDERDSRKGFGLGLPIVRRLVDQLEGTIEVASTKGKGSTFRVRLRHLT